MKKKLIFRLNRGYPKACCAVFRYVQRRGYEELSCNIMVVGINFKQAQRPCAEVKLAWLSNLGMTKIRSK
ncbi:hypothetical protein C8Q79DRAFT_990598 [Trametes meyenii]|nr:hypothetical protein C8Q79DRAFT_990598 [Trametes meyenii]